MIWWHGISSYDVGVIVERYPARPVPKRKGSSQSVAGRSGDLIDQEDAWDNVVQPYEVYLSGEFRGGMQSVAREAIQWLMVKGYQKLEDSYDLDTFRLAYFMGGNDFANTLNLFGRAKIEFNCKPQRFLHDGDTEKILSAGAVLMNPTVYTARPRILLSGSGSGSLTVGSRTMELTDVAGTIIDSDTEDVYRGTTNLNSTASGEFPLLEAGETSVTWEGGITGVRITPRWYVL